MAVQEVDGRIGGAYHPHLLQARLRRLHLLPLLVDEPLEHGLRGIVGFGRRQRVQLVDGAVTPCSCFSACSQTSVGDANCAGGWAMAASVTRPSRSCTKSKIFIAWETSSCAWRRIQRAEPVRLLASKWAAMAR